MTPFRFEQVHKIPITGKLFLISERGKIIMSINPRHAGIGKFVSGDQGDSCWGLQYPPNNLICPQKQCYAISQFLLHFNWH